MNKTALSLLIGSILFLASCGVHTESSRTREELVKGDSTDHIVSLTMTDGNKVEFGDPGGSYSPANQQITGQATHGVAVMVPVSKIESVVISRVNFWWTALAYGVGAALLFVVVLFLQAGAQGGGP